MDAPTCNLPARSGTLSRTLYRALVVAFEQSEPVFSTAQAAEALGQKPATVREKLSALYKLGLARKVAVLLEGGTVANRWQITPMGVWTVA